MPPSLRRNSAATVILGTGRLHILVPPNQLVTLRDADAATAQGLIRAATEEPIAVPEAGTRQARLAEALVEHGVLVPTAEERSGPPEPEEAGAPIRVVYGITGAVDAAMAPLYLKALRRSGAVELRIVVTEAATHFVQPDGLRFLIQAPVYESLFVPSEVNHVELGEWADVVVVNPATAEFCCRLANGGYSDLLGATIAATPRPVVLVPSMNPRMWARQARSPAGSLSCRFSSRDPNSPAGLEQIYVCGRSGVLAAAIT